MGAGAIPRAAPCVPTQGSSSHRALVSYQWRFRAGITSGSSALLYIVEDILGLLILSHWQMSAVRRSRFRLLIPIVAVVSILLTVSAGEFDQFRTTTAVFRSLVILSAALFTLIQRVAVEQTDVWRRDWLWTTIALGCYYAESVAVEPLVGYFLAERRSDFATRVLLVHVLFTTTAFILIANGMRFPLSPLPAVEPHLSGRLTST